ncbi:DsbA family protein [Streptomyces koyangensis]|uniref:Disulfide bond formation protein DsbA n=1 Tax=Streptomyces koyangensis TaxID=188770 RepID=A0A385D5A5_9ACTN|nr:MULTISPECIES: thioredoxin domain-containing protein [Streptomyces]AXQ53516.1 disulfide bond formation protein DsbA [Streptomyces koyangensis]PKR44479.1 disulfide bond formation protein DsbA [Streptomyces sp. EAG2]WTD06806.1 thioredoxin domain-containing protein [Streptomyces albidoflavus]
MPEKSSSSSASGTPQVRARRRRTVAAAGVLVAAAATAAVLAVTSGSDHSPARPVPSSSEAAAEHTPEDSAPVGPDLARRDADDALAVGPVDAPVVMIEYSDFQCPFCGRFARETKQELLRTHVKKGSLRIEWRNFPIFGKESEAAARAAWAAGRQGAFWEFHDRLYAEPRERNSGEFTEAKLVAHAKAVGVQDLDRFREDMASDQAHQAVERDREEGYALGVTSTPAFLVNGTPLLGAQPTETFDEAVRDALARREGETK